MPKSHELLSPKQQEIVTQFLNDILPKIQEAQTAGPIIEVLGVTGAGKSCFINYMLEHEFLVNKITYY